MSDNYILGIVRSCGETLVDKKASDVVLLDLRKVNTYLDYFIICTANSKVHCRALAKEMEHFFGTYNFRSKGKDVSDSDWIVLDYNEIVVHIFTEDVRNYYALEKLWSDADRIV
ncbi:MAG TPA: ribosome silencing factor [Spirochaetota bacterium]